MLPPPPPVGVAGGCFYPSGGNGLERRGWGAGFGSHAPPEWWCLDPEPPLPSGPESGRVRALCLGCCVRVQSGNLPRAQHRVCGVPSGPVTPPCHFVTSPGGLATPWVADRVGVQAEQLAPGGLCPAKPHNEGFEGIKLRTGWF